MLGQAGWPGRVARRVARVQSQTDTDTDGVARQARREAHQVDGDKHDCGQPDAGPGKTRHPASWLFIAAARGTAL